MLAVLWACQECDYYICGAPLVEVRSDHKPLQEIFTKYLHELSDHSLKICIQLLDYSLDIKYIEGKKNKVANCLSHKPIMKNWEHFYPHVEDKYLLKSGQTVMKVDAFNSMDDPALQIILECAKNDKDYNEVIKCVREGLEKTDIKKMHPEHPTKELSHDLAYYWYY